MDASADVQIGDEGFPTGSPTHFEISSMGWRFLAWLIDTALITIVAAGLGLGLSPTLAVVVILVAPLYFLVGEASPWQATVGKRLLGIRVVDNDGNRLSLPHALGRTAARCVAAAPSFLGYAVAVMTPEHLAVHDLMSGTLVIRKRLQQSHV